jgi:hypothetical protein
LDRPVLLINGDSHVFGADQPLADPNSAAGKIHKTQPVPNFTRITVQGSVNTPSEWLRLTIDPHTPTCSAGKMSFTCRSDCEPREWIAFSNATLPAADRE